MKRVKLTIAYDGTNYCGWQIQPNGITVEEVVNRELSRLLKEEIHVIGASRTDSGVHALGNVAVFDTEARIPAEKVSFALNRSLPEDIVIQKSEEVPQDFHPRFCDSTKTYEYRIWNATFVQPVNRLYTYHVHDTLDVEAMQRAAQFIVGEHDFASFCSVGAQVQSTVRTVYSVDVIKENELITIRVTGAGFLYNMVRIIAGTLLQVGLGAKPAEWVREVLEAKDRSQAGPTAPAQGLTLMKIEYSKPETTESDNAGA